MKTVRVYNETKNKTLLERAGLADSFFLRLKGLLGKKGLPPGEGLVIKPCNAVHTLGMKFPIDVAFVNKENRICHIIEGMPPSRVGKSVKGAYYVIEGKPGLFSETCTEVGDLVEVVEL